MKINLSYSLVAVVESEIFDNTAKTQVKVILTVEHGNDCNCNFVPPVIPCAKSEMIQQLFDPNNPLDAWAEWAAAHPENAL